MISLSDMLKSIKSFARLYSIPNGFSSVVFQDNKIFKDEYREAALDMVIGGMSNGIQSDYFMPKHEIKGPTRNAFKKFGTDYILVPNTIESFKGDTKIIKINGELKKGRVRASYQTINPLAYALQIQSKEEFNNHIEGISISMMNGISSENQQKQIGTVVYNPYMDYSEIENTERIPITEPESKPL